MTTRAAAKRQRNEPPPAPTPVTKPAAPPTTPTFTCIVCFDDKSSVLTCSAGHSVCSECFEPFLVSRSEELAKTNLLAAKADAAEASGDARLFEKLAGVCHCPLLGHGCDAATAFEERAVAMHVSEGAFAQYLSAKTLLPAARKVRDVLQKRAELTSLFPNARQCGRCGHGPVELVGCSDLTTHHGEIRPGSERPVDNSCARCGWFSSDISQWPAWDPSRAGESTRANSTPDTRMHFYSILTSHNNPLSLCLCSQATRTRTRPSLPPTPPTRRRRRRRPGGASARRRQ